MTSARPTPPRLGARPPASAAAAAAAAAAAPPGRLPLEHFVAALGWLVVGAAGLTRVAPRLAAGDLLAPQVLAVTHLFTLGIITTTIFGALYQFFPAILGVGARSVRVAHLSFALLTAGTATIALGFWQWWPAVLGAGWLLLFGAVGAFSWTLLPQRRRATQGRTIGLYISAGHAALGFAMLLGGVRIGDALGWWQTSRLGLIAAHFHLAAIGFAALTAVGVGSRLLPSFLVSGPPPSRALRWIGPTGGAGLVVFAVGATFGLVAVRTGGAALLLLAGALYLATVASHFRRRSGGRLDPGLGLVGASFGFFAVALVVGALLAVPAGGFMPRLWMAYGLTTLLGWLVLFICGVLYRILPFLTWLHVIGPASRGADGDPPPPVTALLRPRLAGAAHLSLAAGVAALALGAGIGDARLTAAGSAAFLLGAVLLAVHYALMFRPRKLSTSAD